MNEEDIARKILSDIKSVINKKELIDNIVKAMREHTRKVVKEIQSQEKDAPIEGNWIGFNAYK